jgi:hypothetical protein
MTFFDSFSPLSDCKTKIDKIVSQIYLLSKDFYNFYKSFLEIS